MIPLLTLIALGDSQGSIGTFERVVDQILEQEEDVSAVLHAGDIVDGSYEWDSFLPQIHRLEQSFPVITTRGNHDRNSGYDENFPELPQETDLLDEPFGVTVLSVDSNLQREHQGFVQERVEARPERFFVVLLHHPPRTCAVESGAGPGSSWWRFFEETLRDTDLVIAGHLHVACEYQLRSGTSVLVTARAGRKRYTCLPREELPRGAFCSSGWRPEYLRIVLTDEGEWEWTRVQIR